MVKSVVLERQFVYNNEPTWVREDSKEWVICGSWGERLRLPNKVKVEIRQKRGHKKGEKFVRILLSTVIIRGVGETEDGGIYSGLSDLVSELGLRRHAQRGIWVRFLPVRD